MKSIIIVMRSGNTVLWLCRVRENVCSFKAMPFSLRSWARFVFKWTLALRYIAFNRIFAAGAWHLSKNAFDIKAPPVGTYQCVCACVYQPWNYEKFRSIWALLDELDIQNMVFVLVFSHPRIDRKTTTFGERRAADRQENVCSWTWHDTIWLTASVLYRKYANANAKCLTSFRSAQ